MTSAEEVNRCATGLDDITIRFAGETEDEAKARRNYACKQATTLLRTLLKERDEALEEISRGKERIKIVWEVAASERQEARSKALDEAAELAKKQAQVFRDDAHDQKQLGNRELHKRALVIASFFDAHAIAVAALKDTQT